MGDRCFMHLNIRHIPEGQIEGVISYMEDRLMDIDSYEQEYENGSRDYEIEEINYGGYDELQHLAALGVVFSGSHSAGGEYSAQDFVSHEKQVHYASELGPVAAIDKDGNVHQGDFEAAMRFHKAHAVLDSDNFPQMKWPNKS